MRRNIQFAVLSWVFLLPVGISMADHTLPLGSIDRLSLDVRNLNASVRYSSINYQVKGTVSRFFFDVEGFVRCVKGFSETRDHDLISESCERDMQRVHSSYYSVQRYLYDTYYDFPNVYQNYVKVDRDMRSLPH